MNSITELLSPLDDLEIICEEHGIPCLGLCSNILCKEKTRFLCMKCIKSQNTCITKEKHELVSLSEMLFRFMKKKEESKEIIIKDIQKMDTIIKEYDKNELNNILIQFKSIKEEKSIKIIEAKLCDLIKNFIESFKIKNNYKLEKLKRYSKTNTNNENDIKILLNIRMPEIDNNINSNKKLKEIIKNGCKLSSTKNFVNSIKLLNNKNKLTNIEKNLNKKIYVNNVCSNISNINNNKLKLENKIDLLLNEMEKKFDEKMEQIEKSIILPNEDKSMYISFKSSFISFSSDPSNLEYKEDICNTAHRFNSIDKVFCAFKSFSKESFIVWGTPFYTIEFFNIEKNKVINTIKNAHSNIIYSCRHYQDKKNQDDFIITSSYDKYVKVWNLKTFSCILNIPNTHNNNYIYSACILCDENENINYVISSSPNDFMKIWDFNGRLLNRLGQSDGNTYFIDTFYDNQNKTYYILNGNSTDVKSYTFKDGELYKRYKSNPQSWHMSIIVYENKERHILIESDGNGYIRMWDFHKANLIKSILSSNFVNLRGICLWNEKYLFAASNDHQIKLIDLINGKYVKFYKEHTSTVCTLEKIIHNKYGECLVSQGLDGKIKIWASIKNN